MIPHSRPCFNQDDADEVCRVVASGYTASGEQARRLEQTVKSNLCRKDAVAVDSGTSALMLALLALMMGQRVKRVGIPAYACASLLFAVRAAGCEAVPMDCQMDLRLDAEKARALEEGLDVVILVHPFGMIEPLVNEAWSCPVIEDIAQAAGAELDGKPVGSFGDISIASFYATKPWGGAYGGMVLADEDICAYVRGMIHPDSTDFAQRYVGHHRLSDVHAALALSHMKKAKDEFKRRAQQFEWLDACLPESLVESVAHRYQGSMYRYIVRGQDKAEDWLLGLHQAEIGAERPVQKPYDQALGATCMGAQQAWLDCVSLPVLAYITEDEKYIYKQGLKDCF